ncbi:MAG: hypothetical protein IJ715_03190 [Bacilli bacterium]|nr:hypothetical protein [Bacilli bacterium]
MKYIKYFLFSLTLFFIAGCVSAKEITINLFYSETCPHCQAEEKFLNEYVKENSNVRVRMFEVTRNINNANLLDLVKKSIGSINNYVPYTVIGDVGLTGYSDSIKDQIIHFVDKYQNEDYYDLVSIVEETGEVVDINNYKAEDILKEKKSDDDLIKLPVIGKVNKSKVSIPIVAIIFGSIDGFNPCAMWVLIFLVSMLISVKDKKKRIGLGLVFLIASGLVYMLFMGAWISVLSITQSTFVLKLVGIIAIIGSVWNFSGFIKSKNSEVGCEVTDKEKRKKIMMRIKKYMSEQNFIIASIGLIGLAFSINAIEFVCSAGWPVLYAEILALHNLSSVGYFLAMLLYIIFYMLDDIIVFLIAMVTLEVTGISNKYNKYSHLIGGILMLILGILMIFAPNILMLKF